MGRYILHSKVKTTNGLRWVASCPCCKTKKVVLSKPTTWGARTKAVAEIVDHMIAMHPEVTA